MNKHQVVKSQPGALYIATPLARGVANTINLTIVLVVNTMAMKLHWVNYSTTMQAIMKNLKGRNIDELVP